MCFMQLVQANESKTRFGPDYLKDEEAIDFSLTDVEGKAHTLSSYKGKKVVVCIFQHSPLLNICAVAPMEQLFALQDTYQMLQKYNFEVIAVISARPEAIKELRDQNKFPFIMLYDELSGVASSYGAIEYGYVTQSTLIINEQGVVIDTVLGDDDRCHIMQIFLYALEQSIVSSHSLEKAKVSV